MHSTGWTITRTLSDLAYYAKTGTSRHAQRAGRHASEEVGEW